MKNHQGKRVIARALIPFIRPRTITVTGDCFRPGIRIYAFFDGRDMYHNFVHQVHLNFLILDKSS